MLKTTPFVFGLHTKMHKCCPSYVAALPAQHRSMHSHPWEHHKLKMYCPLSPFDQVPQNHPNKDLTLQLQTLRSVNSSAKVQPWATQPPHACERSLHCLHLSWGLGSSSSIRAKASKLMPSNEFFWGRSAVPFTEELLRLKSTLRSDVATTRITVSLRKKKSRWPKSCTSS